MSASGNDFPRCRTNATVKQAFLEEGLVEEYLPHPLDVGTLFDFLKLFGEEDDQSGTRKMNSLLGGVNGGGVCCCGRCCCCCFFFVLLVVDGGSGVRGDLWH